MTDVLSIAVLMATSFLVSVAAAQQPTSRHQDTVFTAPDGLFRFSYPSDFQICTKGQIQPCIQSHLIRSHNPVCEQDALVCAVYPAEMFKDTNFDAASFQVREILRHGETMSADICVTPYPMDQGNFAPYPEFLISAEHPVETIGSVQFVHGVRWGAAIRHGGGIDLYRAFHRQECWEVSIIETATNTRVSAPLPRTLTAAEQKKLDEMMSDILHSFRFSD